MAKICPQTNDVVLYLECLECPDKGKCIDRRNVKENSVYVKESKIKKLKKYNRL